VMCGDAVVNPRARLNISSMHIAFESASIG